jgi:hypothetical protein
MPSGKRLKKSCRFVKNLGGLRIEKADVLLRTTANASREYSGFFGPELPGALCLNDMDPKAPSTGVLSSGLKMGRLRNSGEASSPNWKRMTISAGMNVLWTEHLLPLKKGVLRRKNQAREGNEAYGIG